jgi:hypothetical protein
MIYLSFLDSDIDLELSETETGSNNSTGPFDSDLNDSPSRASSPIHIPSRSDFLASNNNDMDVDSSSVAAHPTTTDSGEQAWGRRSVTPTRESGSRQTTPVPHRIVTSSTSQRLRTRRSRSSLSQSLTSPKAIHAIKSPTLAASNAFNFHTKHNPNAGNDLDLQSAPPSLTLRPRRLFARRRLPSTPIPAPAPPPTMPLPDLPLQVQVPVLWSPNPLEDSTQHNLLSAFKSSDTKSGDVPHGRRRGLSRSSLAGDEHRIIEIEEMKEN